MHCESHACMFDILLLSISDSKHRIYANSFSRFHTASANTCHPIPWLNFQYGINATHHARASSHAAWMGLRHSHCLNDASPPARMPATLSALARWCVLSYFVFCSRHCLRSSSVASLLQFAVFSCLAWAHSLRAFESEMVLQSTFLAVWLFMHCWRAEDRPRRCSSCHRPWPVQSPGTSLAAEGASNRIMLSLQKLQAITCCQPICEIIRR